MNISDHHTFFGLVEATRDRDPTTEDKVGSGFGINNKKHEILGDEHSAKRLRDSCILWEVWSDSMG